MNINQLKVIKKWFHAYVEDITPDNDKLIHLIRLKYDHSLHVAENSRLIAEGMKWLKSDINVAEALGLLHDVGRFSQVVEYRTFYDPDSINHGERGFKVVGESGILSALPQNEQMKILDGIKFHNLITIPQYVNSARLRFVKLIRDADKLDIYRIIYDTVKTKIFEEHPEIFLNIDFDGPINPAALAQILNKETVSYRNVKSFKDFCLNQLSWMYDINYSLTFRLISEREIFKKVTAILPEDNGVQKAVRSVHAYMKKEGKG
ncbi:MAG: HD domain-containing protein [Candidatus Latescibacteria bacterium]|jgi:hypothetical protein|nr:HD domain-containing protein [Candidatus Latescibacterota bacterium]